MKVHDVVAGVLRAQGVDVVFGLVGDGNLYMMDSFVRRGGRFVAVANESAAMLAASGYAGVTGELAVGTVTHGPGLTNTMTSLIELVKHRRPAVLIAGDTPTRDPDNLQDVPQRRLSEACGAGFVAARAADLVADDLASAIRQALSERRPVVFDIPAELQWQDVDDFDTRRVPTTADALAPDRRRLEDAVAVLSTSRRPLILAGRGAIDAREQLLLLARRLGAPVATTVQARQLFRDHPLDLGLFGGTATEVGLETILQADCILAFGASLNRWTTVDGSLLADRSVIQVDSDPSALGRLLRVSASVLGDAATVASGMIELLDEAMIPPTDFGGSALEQRLQAAKTERRAAADRHREIELLREQNEERPPGTVDLRLAMDAVDAVLPAARTLTIDAGRQSFTALAVLRVNTPRDYVHTIQFGAIGLSIPYAIGAAIGTPHQPTLAVTGDGGFMLGGIVEFVTAVRENLDLVVAVMNDASYGAEHIQFVNKGLDPSLSLTAYPDLAPVAESLGGAGMTVRTLADLDGLAERVAAREPGRPLLIDIKLSADEISAAS